MRLALQDLTVNFSAPDGSQLAALGPVSFDVESGSFVTLLGPSGCGKSTLVRVLAGLLPLTTGSTLLDGQPINEPSPHVGLMFQDANLMPWRTVQDNVALPLEVSGVSKQQRYQWVDKILPVLGLEDFADMYPGELSGGMAQRAALGRILVQRPEVVLLDEPFGALDALTREKISFDLLRIWAKYRQTVLMVTHDIHEAIMLADRVLVMSNRPGRIIGDIVVPLERPRKLEMRYCDEFSQTARTVRELIDRA